VQHEKDPSPSDLIIIMPQKPKYCQTNSLERIGAGKLVVSVLNHSCAEE
jgi:hypothetical protein